jgi:thiol-disulfide isomerase/thioredoxin
MSFVENLKSTLKALYCAHYIVDILLATSFILLKATPYVCDLIYENCILEWREYEILILLMIFVAIRSRKAATGTQFISMLCTYAKAANVVLYWREEPWYVLFYGLACFLHFVFLPQPIYRGPSRIKEFRGTNLTHEIGSDDRIVWLVCFYAHWNSSCREFSSVFAQLSNKYGDLNNLKFAKLDAYKYQDLARSYNISTSSLSKQLPTLILFKKGQEFKRRPFIDSKGSVFPFIFSYDNIIKEFDLNTLYYECKQNPIQIKPVSSSNEAKKSQ